MILKATYFLLFISALVIGVHGQNIITNGDMEIYTSCPVGFSNPGNPEIQKCVGWYHPTFATSDFFHTCAVGTNVAVPSSAVGFQYPQSGSGYLGFAAYFADGGIVDWYEYITNSLSEKMNFGEKYRVSCYMVSANCEFATKEIGFYFHPDSFHINDVNPLPYTPQYKLNYYIIDTLVWQKVEFDYIASGNEKYVTLGYFANTTDTLRIGNFSGGSAYSYYHVDNFEINYVSNVADSILNSIPNIFTPNNDGINDFYTIHLPIIVDYIKIYNRWGTELYSQEKTKTISWDGLNASEGVYYYVIGNQGHPLKSGFFHLFY